MRIIGLAALTLALALSGQALAQQPPTSEPIAQAPRAPEDDPGTRVDDIIVPGRRLEEAAAAFVEDIAAPAAVRGLARWNRPVCFGVMNMRRDIAESLLERLTSTAIEHGIELQEPDCEPDVLIIATEDGAEFATQLVAATRRRLFRPGAGATRIGQPPSVLEHFQTTDAPVRWWQTSLPTDSQTGTIMVRFRGDRPPSIAIDNVSKMRGRIRDDLKRVLIIVDVNAASSATWTQLGDYLAMVAFAQIDAVSDKRSHSTILNLFEDDLAPPGLTAWDRAYLRSLYGADNRRILAFERASALAEQLGTSGAQEATVGERE